MIASAEITDTKRDITVRLILARLEAENLIYGEKSTTEWIQIYAREIKQLAELGVSDIPDII